MSERLSALLWLIGGVLVLLALWYLSYRFVRWDTRRRGLRELHRKAWLVAVVALPLFGFALYLAVQVMHRYLTPFPDENRDQSARQTDVRMGNFDPRGQHTGAAPRQVPMPQPAWSDPAAPRSNGGTHAGTLPAAGTPVTIPAQYSPMHARYALVALEGPHLGQHFLIDPLPALIGRGAEPVVALDQDLNVSRRHAEIYEWNGLLRVRDLDSAHGTYINDALVADQQLNTGDRLGVGKTVLILRELP